MGKKMYLSECFPILDIKLKKEKNLMLSLYNNNNNNNVKYFVLFYSTNYYVT